MERLRGLGRVAVVTAGRVQLERLEKVLLDRFGILANVDFLPTFPALARRVLPGAVLEDEAVPALDRILLGLRATDAVPADLPYGSLRDNASAAASLADFFEDLLDRGVSAEIYSTQVDSLSTGDPTPTEQAVRTAFLSYSADRRSLFPCTADQLVGQAAGSADWSRYAAVLFYGYYDLNPVQRRLLRSIIARPAPELCFFDPMTSGWIDRGSMGSRTLELIYSSKGSRPDAAVRPGRFQAFSETLLTRGVFAEPPAGFTLVEAAGLSAAARAVTAFLDDCAGAGIPPRETAVIGREPVLRAAAVLASSQGHSIRDKTRIPVGSLPEGALAGALLEIRRESFHHLQISRLIATGALDPALRLTGACVESAVRRTGIRFGLENWLEAGAAGLDHGLAGLVERLSEMDGAFASAAGPEAAVDALFACASRICAPELRDRVAALGTALRPRCRWPVRPDALSDAVMIALGRIEAEEARGAGDGVRFISPEHARGASFRAVCVTGLEEGVLPVLVRDDSRLTEELARLLEMPGRAERERSEAFLLHQAMEAAGERLSVVYRTTEPDGRPLAPSAFLDPLIAEIERQRRTEGGARGPGWLAHQPSSPAKALFGGNQPGHRAAGDPDRAGNGVMPAFLAGASSLEILRRSGAFGEGDAVLEVSSAGWTPPSGLRVTDLVSWYECPFRFLVRRVWRIPEKRNLGVRTIPDPRETGSMVHRSLEAILRNSGTAPSDGEIAAAVEEVLSSSEFARQGSPALMQSAAAAVSGGVKEFLGILRSEGWRPVESEKDLRTTIGGTLITGRADLVAEDADGRILLLDFKTGRARVRTRVLKAMSSAGDLQILLYQSMAGSENLHVDRLGYVFRGLEPGRQPVFDTAELDAFRPAAERTAAAIVDAIRTGFFPPGGFRHGRDPDPCRNCDLHSMCRRSQLQNPYIEKWASDPRAGAFAPAREDGRQDGHEEEA